MDLERTKNGIFTYVGICVETDFKKGLPNHINMKHQNLTGHNSLTMKIWHLDAACVSQQVNVYSMHAPLEKFWGLKCAS